MDLRLFFSDLKLYCVIFVQLKTFSTLFWELMVVLCGSSKCHFSDRDDNSCRFVSCVCFIFWPQRTAAELVREMAVCAAWGCDSHWRVCLEARGHRRWPERVGTLGRDSGFSLKLASLSPHALSPAFWKFKKLAWDSRVWIPQGSWGPRALCWSPPPAAAMGAPARPFLLSPLTAAALDTPKRRPPATYDEFLTKTMKSWNIQDRTV